MRVELEWFLERIQGIAEVNEFEEDFSAEMWGRGV